jgi:hypothetical protein
MTTDNPTRAKFLPVPGMFEERHDRDLMPTTTSAFQPLLEAVQRLGASIDRVTERVETNHRADAKAESERRLDALREYLRRPIKASALQTEGYGHRSPLVSWAPDEGYSS